MEFNASRLVGSLPDLVWIAFPDGQIDFLNERWRRYNGLSPQEASGWGWQTAIHSDLPNVLGDWVRLQQVILSLILNAADAMMTVVAQEGPGAGFCFTLPSRPFESGLVV